MKFCSALLLLLAQQAAAQGTDLGGGVVTRTDVEYLADLALDVRDMRQFLRSEEGGAEDALRVYNDGRNSEKRKGFKYPLSSLSEDLAVDGASGGTPNYVYHLYGLGDGSTDVATLNANAFYADAFIKQVTQEGAENDGPNAVVALSMWMYTTHLIMDGFEICQKKTVADNPGQFDVGGGGMDEFIALWIGNDAANSLYGLTQTAAAFFGAPGVEAAVNTNIKILYQQGATLLSVETACSKDTPDTPRLLWNIAQQIIAQMQIPLMQMLIHSIVQQDVKGVALYGLAVVPQISQCRPSIFKRLNKDLLVGVPNFSRSRSILEDLREIYPCLGFTCTDLGEYTVGGGSASVPACPLARLQPAMAQYRPTSSVHPISRIDLDVLQLRILSSLERFGFAKYLYQYGRNSPVQHDSISDPFEFHSLADFAVSTSRRDADPYYTAFVEYHNDPNYADTIIRGALDGTTEKWRNSVEQRTAVVAETAAFQIMFLEAISQINDAVTACESGAAQEEMLHPWDEVAALVIGSLEGPNEGGSGDVQDGQLIWSLANKRAFQFQTLNGKGYSDIASKIEDLLFAGRGELDAENCDSLRRTADQLKATILIPLLQSTVRYAIQNENLSSTSTKDSLALGEAYALATIPFISTYDENAANIVEESLVVQPGVDLVRDGAQAVAEAAGAAADANGMGCQSLGSTSQVNPCAGSRGSSSSSTLQLGISILAVGIVTVMVS